jgi:hypothetical protein
MNIKRRRGIPGTLLVLCLVVLSSCATKSATVSPGVDLSKIKTIYVIKLPADERGVNGIIAEQLQAMGYQATTGNETEIPQDVDATLTYQDRWMWDITMYMIELNIQLRDPQAGFLLAEGESYRPSKQRTSPAEMALEVLESMLSKR